MSSTCMNSYLAVVLTVVVSSDVSDAIVESVVGSWWQHKMITTVVYYSIYDTLIRLFVILQ